MSAILCGDGVKKRWPLAHAREVAAELMAFLEPYCEPGRLMLCGSARRGKALVGDIELVYVPRFEPAPAAAATDLFAPPAPVNQVDRVLEYLLGRGWLEKRANVNGSATWGEKNKLARHVESGLPVDLFTSSAEGWASYVVCRTGPAEWNTRMAMGARDRGWRWNPYEGFWRRHWDREAQEMVDEWVRPATERECIEFAGLKYAEPEGRV